MKLEEIMTIDVKVNSDGVQQLTGEEASVIMIPFEGSVSGKYFNGTVLPGGVDTQVIGPGTKRHTLSARYIIEGTDYTGEPCSVYIENNGVIHGKDENEYFITQPTFITNSEALDFLNTDLFTAEALAGDCGPKIVIYRVS